MNRNPHNRTLTALEIGVIIAVIALVAVSIGMWLAAKREEKRRSHFQIVATALRAYVVDYNAFPPPLTEYRELGPTSRTLHTRYRNWAQALTTPVAYLAPVHGLDDPFAPTTDRRYRYMSYQHIHRFGDGADEVSCSYCVLAGFGPDRDEDLPLDRLRFVLMQDGQTWGLREKHALPRPLVTYCYDPTNGKRSDGDLIEIIHPKGGLFPPYE